MIVRVAGQGDEGLMPLVDRAAATAIVAGLDLGLCARASAAAVSMPSASNRCGAVAGSPQSTTQPAAL